MWWTPIECSPFGEMDFIYRNTLDVNPPDRIPRRLQGRIGRTPTVGYRSKMKMRFRNLLHGLR